MNPNDVGDGDAGPNNLQNYPVLTSVTNSGGMTHIAGTLNSLANTTFRIEFFSSDILIRAVTARGRISLASRMSPPMGAATSPLTRLFHRLGQGNG